MTIGIPSSFDPLPVFTWAHNWTDPITETYEWLTQVMQGDGGDELRYARRLTPRRSFQYTVLLSGSDRAQFDAAINYAGGFDWYFPNWQEAINTKAPLAAHQTTFATNLVNRELPTGSLVLVAQTKPGGIDHTIAEVTVATVSGSTITFSPGLFYAYKNAVIVPLIRGHMDQKPQLSRSNANTFNAVVNWTATKANAYDMYLSPAVTYKTFQSYYVLDLPPDENQSNSLNYDRLEPQFDGDTGIVQRFDFAFTGFRSQSHTWFVYGRTAYKNFVYMLYILKGRQQHFWLPTFANDVVLLYDMVAGSNTTMKVAKMHLNDWGGITPDRRRLWIATRDGQTAYRTVEGYDDSNAAYDEIFIDTPLSPLLAVSNTRCISFMQFARSDTDSFVLNHTTDPSGLTTCGITFKNLKLQAPV